MPQDFPAIADVRNFCQAITNMFLKITQLLSNFPLISSNHCMFLNIGPTEMITNFCHAIASPWVSIQACETCSGIFPATADRQGQFF